MADAENILNELITKIGRENQWKNYKVDIKAITSGGANYSSTLHHINISLPDEDLKLFAKVVCIAQSVRDALPADDVFNVEAFFYNSLAKTYDDLQRKQGLSAHEMFRYPKFYGSNNEPCKESVVLENLVAKGYDTYDRFKSVDWEHAAASIEALAKFHALSFAYQKSNPEEFEMVCGHLKVFFTEDNDQMRAMWENMGRNKIDSVNEEYLGRLRNFLEKGLYNLLIKYQHPIKTKVITHGDYRPSNILYKKQGTKVDAIPVDYQTLHTGNPITDLIYFESLSTDSAFRAKYHDRLVEFYYSELEKALKRLDVDINEVYPREVFDEELKQTLAFSIINAICILPIVLVETEKAPELGGDMIEGFAVAGTEAYSQRLNGIVEDCVRWGCI